MYFVEGERPAGDQRSPDPQAQFRMFSVKWVFIFSAFRDTIKYHRPYRVRPDDERFSGGDTYDFC